MCLQTPAESPTNTKIAAGEWQLITLHWFGRLQSRSLHAIEVAAVDPAAAAPGLSSWCSHPVPHYVYAHPSAVWEPTVAATIVTPNDYVGSIMTLCQVSPTWSNNQRRCVALPSFELTVLLIGKLKQLEWRLPKPHTRLAVWVHSLPPTAVLLFLHCTQDRRGDMLEHSVLGAGRTLLK